MRCPNCGFNAENCASCPICGTPFTQQPQYSVPPQQTQAYYGYAQPVQYAAPVQTAAVKKKTYSPILITVLIIIAGTIIAGLIVTVYSAVFYNKSVFDVLYESISFSKITTIISG